MAQIGPFAEPRIVNGSVNRVKWLRRAFLEGWAMTGLAAVIGFLGPFGTYTDGNFLVRIWTWSVHLLGAYVLIRPVIWILERSAKATSLPATAVVFWGVVIASVPLALVWTWGASLFFHALGGFSGILPFAFISALAILGVVAEAKRIDQRLMHAPAARSIEADVTDVLTAPQPAPLTEAPASEGELSLRARLSAGFNGPILALQSEDHYVRVHGASTSELLLIRLRDAIREMDDLPGQQVHRSWWVAKEAVAEFEGRRRSIVLVNGARVPIACDIIGTLERVGFFTSARRSD